MGEIIGRARRAPSCEIGWCADHGHSHRPHHPKGDHVRSGPVFWADSGIEALRDDVDRGLGGVDLKLDVGKGR
jgi:hypothetical protein